MATLNPDGISIKGAQYIYAPAGQAGEYAPLAANPYRGCGHGCAYCYVPLVTKQPRPEFDAGALPADRIAALKAFHDAGIFTWVSLEPTLDAESSLAIVETTHRFVDLYKVGRVNYLPMTKTTDWRDYTLRMVDLLTRLRAKHYIKKDLQPFLPDGYPNPLRVTQHH